MRRLALSLAVLATLAAPALAAERTMIVLDASGSMWGQIGGKAKMDIARDTLDTVLQSVKPETELGLMVYGHRQKGACSDIELAVPAAKGTAKDIAAFARKISPKGKTPISASVTQAAEALKFTEDKATIVLVTDGLETCEADPCAVASALEKQGVDFTVHVVGFGLTKDEGKQVACLAENTGGKYFAADDAKGLSDALVATVTEAPPVVKEEPKPEPKKEEKKAALENNVETDAFLAEGGPSLGDNDAVRWEFRAILPDGTVANDMTDVVYRAVTKAQLPAGKYRVIANLGQIKRETDIVASDTELAKPVVTFNAAELTIVPKRTPQDSEADANARVDAEFAEGKDGGYGQTKIYVSAGEVKLTGDLGPAKAAETITVKAGDIVKKDLIIGSGILVTKAVYAEGGPDVDTNNIFFEVVSAKKKIDGSTDSINNAYGTGSKIDVPAGDFVLTARLGKATAELPFSIAAGQSKELTLNINAGIVAISSPGAYRIDILEAKKDIEGKNKVISGEFGETYQETLPPGDYIVRKSNDAGETLKEAPVTIKAGERSEVTVE